MKIDLYKLSHQQNNDPCTIILQKSLKHIYKRLSSSCCFTTTAPKVLPLFLSICLAFEPILLQIQPSAAQMVPSQRIKATHPQVDTASNGVPLINISRPNKQGLSHNQYEHFNIDKRGAIFNNSTRELSQSQLGGLVPGNENLRMTGPAKIILNEVVSANRSRLEGISEVHGRAADLIIANPNGITCDGCGFINTPRVTLSTGQPLINKNGTLYGLQVKSGDIAIEKNGGDGHNLDIFDLVSRKIKIAGPIQSKGALALITGHANFNYRKRETKNLSSDGQEPELAIDSSLMGGMYAGQIRVIANDKGAGVNMAGPMVANAKDMVLTSDGTLSIGKARAKGAVQASSYHGNTRVKELLFSEKAVELQAFRNVELDDHARVATKGDVTVAGDKIKLGRDALLASGVDEAGLQHAKGELHLHTNKLKAGMGRIAGGNLLLIEAATIDLDKTNAKPKEKNGEQGQSKFKTGLSSLGQIEIKANTIKARSNYIGAKDDILITTDDTLSLSSGLYESQGLLLVEAGQLTANASLKAQKGIELHARKGNITQKGNIATAGSIIVSARNKITQRGGLIGNNQITLIAGGTMATNTNSLILAGGVNLQSHTLHQLGTIEARNGTLTLDIDKSIDNSGTIRGIDVQGRTQALYNTGVLLALNDLVLSVTPKQDSTAPQRLKSLITNGETGIIQSSGAFLVTAEKIKNAGNLGSSGSDIEVKIIQDLQNNGLIYAK